MVSVEPVVVDERVVALDYSQFYLRSGESCEDDVGDAVAEAGSGVGIAQRDGLLVVTSPHQNNFRMPLRVEVWDAAPRATRFLSRGNHGSGIRRSRLARLDDARRHLAGALVAVAGTRRAGTSSIVR